MTKPNAANERIKYEYFGYLEQAMGRDPATINGVAKSLSRFEESTKARDFKRFHRAQAVAFKTKLAKALNVRTGERISKATMLSTLRDLRGFFFWLAHLPGFKSHIAYADADYFNLSDKDVSIARAKREKRVPTLAQVHRVLSAMPADTVLERRDRALVAFTAMTGARVGALASFRLEHLDMEEGFVEQDARTVRTKFSRTFRTFFIPIGGEARAIFTAWVAELEGVHDWSRDQPLFPPTQTGLDENGCFCAAGLSRTGWSTTQPINAVFRRAFDAAGLTYYNPHSFRDMLIQFGYSLNPTIEEFKSWSQNLGHTDMMTTLMSYGRVPVHRQGELIRAAGPSKEGADWTNDADVQALLKVLASKAGKGG